MQRLDFHHALQMGPFGLSPFNRVAFCRHFTGYSMSFTQRGAREKVTRSEKPTLYLMRFEFAFCIIAGNAQTLGVFVFADPRSA